MTEEEKEERKQRRKEKARERVRARYWRVKDTPEYKERAKAYRQKYYETHPEVKKEQQRRYYERKRLEGGDYFHKYYLANKDRMLNNCKKWRAEHADQVREYQRNYSRMRRAATRKKKEAKALPDAEQIATIFKNPVAAEHYKWLMQKRGYKQESEVEHEVTE